MLAEKAVSRVLLLAMQGKPAAARAYLATMLPKALRCDDIRTGLQGHGLSDEALAFLDGALPWLAEPTLGENNGAKGAINVRTVLDGAGGRGLPRSELDPIKVAELIESGEAVEFDQPTGGRPKRMVRLAEHDPRTNIWASPVK